MITAEIERSRILVLLYFGKYVELNLFKQADQNNSWSCSFTKSSKVCGLKSYENMIYSPYVFVALFEAKSSYFHFGKFSRAEIVLTCLNLSESSLL